MTAQGGSLPAVRISHRKLQWVVNEPARALKGKGGGGYSATNVLYQAIHTFHESGERDAQDLLETRLAAFGPGDARRYEGYFDDYVEEFKAQGHDYASSQQPLSLEIGQDLVLGGRIDRIDVTPDGFAVWLFSIRPDPLRWHDRLAMPLIQHGVAAMLGADADSISVGWYWFERATYSEHKYSAREIAVALEVARGLAHTIAALRKIG